MTAAKAIQTKGTYHHGDLRAALVTVGCALIENEGTRALTLRRVSILLSVSQTASAHHFGDKEGLEAAIATECFRRLTTMLIRARNASDSPAFGLANMLRGYLQFSQDFPSGFELMFGARLARNPRHTDLLAASRICYDLLEDAVRAALPEVTECGHNLHNATVASWSIIHGMSGINAGFGLPAKVRAARTSEQIRDNVIAAFVNSLVNYV
jgi:AcrR family transcriptional regulator